MTTKDSKTTQVATQTTETNAQQMELISETYVDGVVSVGVRQNVAKIDFYQAFPLMNKENPNEQQELRRTSQRLILPISGLFEFQEILEKLVNDIKKKEDK